MFKLIQECLHIRILFIASVLFNQFHRFIAVGKIIQRKLHKKTVIIIFDIFLFQLIIEIIAEGFMFLKQLIQ